MNVNRLLKIQEEDALNTFRRFLAVWWDQVKLDALFTPVEQPDQVGVSLKVLSNPKELELVNPFAPIMLINSAAAVKSFINEHSGERLAVILRPCELRTLVELYKRQRIATHTQFGSGEERRGWHPPEVTLIGVDCPGTFSVEEYSRCVVSLGIENLVRETLAYRSEDNPLPGKLRLACTLCDSPAPLGADIVIGTLGAAPRGYLLVIASDEATDQRLQLEASTDAIAEEEQVIHREFAIHAITKGHAARQRALTVNGELLQPDSTSAPNLFSLLGLFANCTLCADCLDACPLYDGELEGMLGVNRARQSSRPLLSELVGVSRWLVSCSGCGMCQEACDHSVTFAPLISSISHRLRSELHYTAGDPFQHLPWELA